VLFSQLSRQPPAGATSGTVTANPPGAPEFTSSIYRVRVAWSVVLCVVFHRSLFVLCTFSFSHCLSFNMWLRITSFVSSIFSYTVNVLTYLTCTVAVSDVEIDMSSNKVTCVFRYSVIYIDILIIICMRSLSYPKSADLFWSYDWQINQVLEDLHVVSRMWCTLHCNFSKIRMKTTGYIVRLTSSLCYLSVL
jgi:hypothetical protein